MENLKRLASLRLLTCMGIALVCWIIGIEQSPPLQIFMIASCVLAMVLLSAVNLYRAKQVKISPSEMFSYLLLDTLLIAALVYFSGGANNPFITYLLVPIVISSATLSWGLTWVLCIFAMCAYGILLFFYQPLLSLDVQLAQLGLSLHIVGMWLTFVLSALFIAYFVVDMSWDLRQQVKQNAKLTEQSIQNEHVMLLASQAASTAHEIGSPLTTLKVLSHELSLEKNLSKEAKEDLALMDRQIELCQQKLKSLTDQSQKQSAELSPLPLHEFIHTCLQQWLLMSPRGQYEWLAQSKHNGPSPDVQYPQVLQQAIINLLDNAQNASQQTIKLLLNWNQTHWQLIIEDNGPGLEQGFEMPSRPIHSQNGLGIGLLLSHSSIQRLGGKVELSNRQNGSQILGCNTLIELPINTKRKG